jgi:hypothetical protein
VQSLDPTLRNSPSIRQLKHFHCALPVIYVAHHSLVAPPLTAPIPPNISLSALLKAYWGRVESM